MSKEVFDILKCLVSLVCLIVGYMVIPYLKAKIYSTKYSTVVAEALNVVKYLQQTLPKEQNDEKYDLACKYLVDYAMQHGVNLTVEQMRILIESAVYTMKHTMEK